MKRLFIALLTTSAVFVAPAVAYGVSNGVDPAPRAAALPSFKKMGNFDTTGVSWRGHYRFLPPGEATRGAFNFKGTLRSHDKNNGAKLEVRVEGYSKRTYRAARGTTKRHDERVYDGAAQRTKNAWVKLCRDRGSLVPDNCTGETHYER